MRGKHNLLFLAIIVAAIAALTAGGIAVAQQDRGYYTPHNSGEIRQPAAEKLKNGATYSAESFPLYPAELEAGEGREAVASNCSTCHSTRYITMQPPLPAAAWEAEVNKMVNAFGLDVPPETKPVIIHYLQTHYTPETRKH
jgi:mono/diheme cytochrome c family protein